MNPDQRESLERKNPHRYGGLGLVSIYVHECQTLLFCVNLYCSKPAIETPARSMGSESVPFLLAWPGGLGWACGVLGRHYLELALDGFDHLIETPS